MSLVLKIFLGLLQALPALLDVFSRRQMEQKQVETKERIDADPINEFEREFGRVSADDGTSATNSEGVHSAESNRGENKPTELR